jgi:hypothetical protein
MFYYVLFFSFNYFHYQSLYLYDYHATVKTYDSSDLIAKYRDRIVESDAQLTGIVKPSLRQALYPCDEAADHCTGSI